MQCLEGTKLRVLKTPWLWEISSNKFFFFETRQDCTKEIIFQHYDLGFHWKRPLNNPCVRNQKPNGGKLLMRPMLWRMTNNFPSKSWGPFLHNHIWWTVMGLFGFWWTLFPAKYYSCNGFFATHLTSFYVYIYIYMDIFVQVTGITGPHQIASESHWIVTGMYSPNRWHHLFRGCVHHLGRLLTCERGCNRWIHIQFSVQLPAKIWGEKKWYRIAF